MWFPRNAGFGAALCIFKSARVSELLRLGDALLAAPREPLAAKKTNPPLLVCLREHPFVALPSRLMPPPPRGYWGTNP
uniref:Uncharacterized protein n=1 Tax=Piliocolobus tephrosceles TaxID=591936 RepID=A0A8C9IQM8_9PRIM